jgi:hypothetical protein
MKRRASLALMMVGLLVSPAVAGFTIYAPGAAVTPTVPKAYGVPGVSVVVPLYMVGTGFTTICDTQVQYNPDVLQIVNLDTDVSAGSLNPGWTVAAAYFPPKVPSSGVVNISGYGEDGITNPSGNILDVLIRILPNSPAGPWNIGLAAFDITHITYVGGYIAMGFPGDADLNGTVNGADLNTVLSDYNQTFSIAGNPWAAWTYGDFNQDGTVNGADLNIVLSNYNLTAPVTASVPEPGTLGVLVLAALAVLAWKGSRNRK